MGNYIRMDNSISTYPSWILNVFFIWTIVAIPNIMAHFRMVPVAFVPFGRKIISKELGQKLRDAKADKEFEKLK